MVSAGGNAVLLCALVNAILLEQGYVHPQSGYGGMLFSLPLLLCSLVLFRIKNRPQKQQDF